MSFLDLLSAVIPGLANGNMLTNAVRPQQGNMLAPLPAPIAPKPIAEPRQIMDMPPAQPQSIGASQPAQRQSGGMFDGVFRPGFEDRLADMYAGFASGKDFNSSVANAGLIMAEGQRDRRSRGEVNQTREAAVRMGLDPQAAAGMDGRTLASYIINKQKGVEPTDDIREFQFAKSQGFTGSFEDWQTKKRGAGDEEFGLNPIYGTDAQGNAVIMQPSKKGGVKSVDLPGGVKLSTGIDKIDVGTQYALQDKKSGQIVGYLPKDVAGEASAKASGAVQGAAAAEVGATAIGADQISRQIDDLKNDPAFDSVIGPIDGRTPNVSADAHRVQSKIDQLKGGAFLQAFQALKGGGAITEMEGAKAQAAMARMDQAQSETDFRKALDDFNEAVRTGLSKLQARAGQTPGAQPSAPSGAPKVREYDRATGAFR